MSNNRSEKPTGLVLRGLTVTLEGETVLRDVSLRVDSGEMVLLVGESGAGKSTLARAIAGFVPEETRTVEEMTIGGEDISRLEAPQRSPYAAIQFQNSRLSFCMDTLREEMIFCLENRGTNPDAIAELVNEAARRFGVERLLDRPIDVLSGGELQKAAFACLRLVDPALFILDEPSANLDERAAARFSRELRAIADQGKAVLVIDHRPERWRMCNRVVLLGRGGSILLDCPMAELGDKERELLEEQGVLFRYARTEESSAEKEPILSAKNLAIYAGEEKKLFRRVKGERLLENASFTLRRGELCALLGESGCGKSTLFSAILGDAPFDGTLADAKGIPLRKSSLRIGLVFQDPSLQFVRMRCSEELRLSLDLWDVGESEDRDEKAVRMLELHGLGEYADRSPWLLSQGEQRRLAVVCMMAADPDLLLVDEPTYGQDARHAARIMDELSSLADRGVSVMFTGHDTRLANAYADRILRIEDGALREEAVQWTD